MNTEERELLRQAIDVKQRERMRPHESARLRNDEIVRQYVECGRSTEEIAGLLGVRNYVVREKLRKRGIPVGRLPVRVQMAGEGTCSRYRLSLPAAIKKQFPQDVTFTCELTDDGILYRPVV
jgi:tRNA isopentenyl-2-thiomethyl-A-37 hydroxylase MiaE